MLRLALPYAPAYRFVPAMELLRQGFVIFGGSLEPVIHGSPVLPLSGSFVPRCSGSRICPFSFAMLYPLFLKNANSWAHFLLAAAQVVGSSVLVFLSSSVLAFLSSSVLWFFDSLSSSSLKLSCSEVLKHLYSQES